MSKKKLGGYVTKPGFMTKLKEGIHQKNKQTAEGYDQKWIGRYSQLREEFNLMESITKLVKEVQAEYASLPSGYCRWVKASERLPEIGGLYHVKYQAKHFDNFVSSKGTARLHDGNWLFNANHKSENIIELEWLEESPSTIDARQIASDAWGKCVAAFIVNWKAVCEDNFDVIDQAKETYLQTIK